MVYLDGFARVCYPAEIQDDDHDEELIPVEEPSNPLSDGVLERDTPMQQVYSAREGAAYPRGNGPPRGS